MITFETRVIDIDAKGNNRSCGGLGTVFETRVVDGKDVLAYFGWQTNQEHEKNQFLEPYRKLRIDQQKKFDDAEQEARKQALEARMSKLSENNDDPVLFGIVDSVLDKETTIVQQYKSGNEKAINSLVGKVMSQGKFDPVAVKSILLKKLK